MQKIKQKFNLMKKELGNVNDYIIFYRAVDSQNFSRKEISLAFDKFVGKDKYDDVTKTKLIDEARFVSKNGHWKYFEADTKVVSRIYLGMESISGDQKIEKETLMHKAEQGILTKEDAFFLALAIEREAIRVFSIDGNRMVAKLQRAMKKIEKVEPASIPGFIKTALEIIKVNWLPNIESSVNDMQKSESSLVKKLK